MKIVLIIIAILLSSYARENPFEPLFETPQTTEEVIPLLHITSNQVFSSQKLELNNTILTHDTNTTIPSDLNSTITKSSENNSTTKSIDLNSTITTTIKKKPHKKTEKKIKKKLNKKIKKKLNKKIKKKRQKPKHLKRKYSTIYQNYFLKIESNHKNFKIYTQDMLLKKIRYTNPTRIALDFDRLQYFHTKHITFNRAFARKIKIGSHHHFYRITVELNKYKRYKLLKKSYGYLLTLY